MRQAILDTEWLGRRGLWHAWYDAAHVTHLANTEAHLNSLGMDLQRTLSDVAQHVPRPWPEDVMRKVRSNTQRAIYQQLMAPLALTAEGQMRHKLVRWRLPGLPGRVARCVLRRLRILRRWVTPRVQAAVLRTLFNGWPTERRWQRSGDCLLGCACPSQADSIEHYLRCPIVRATMAPRLRLHWQPAEAWTFLLFADVPQGIADEPATWARVAIAVYAIYRTVQAARNTRPLDAAAAHRALRQATFEATRGHTRSLRLLLH